MNEWKMNGCNPSTTEKGNLGFSSFGNRGYKYLFFRLKEPRFLPFEEYRYEVDVTGCVAVTEKLVFQDRAI